MDDRNPFTEAVELERRLREEAYIDAPHFICGHPLKQITPRLLAVLFRIRTPFLGSGEVADEEIVRFLWALHVENPMRAESARWFRKTAKQRFLASVPALDFAEAEAGIWEFLDHTFLDSPDGPASRPYVCSIASIEYSMSCKPFGWQRAYTMDQPLRIIYQLMKCRARENGALLRNRLSDPILQTAIDDVNSPEEMARRAEEFRARHMN